jgi:uncharacterized membrane protein
MKKLILFLIAWILVPLIDYIWLGKIAQGFYLSELGSLVREADGKFDPLIWAAALVYVGLAGLITEFVLPLSNQSLKTAAFKGFLMGFFVYLVYDATNLSLLKNWPLHMSMVDVVWGGVLCSLVSVIVLYCDFKLSKYCQRK